jgi:hypothetical protein
LPYYWSYCHYQQQFRFLSQVFDFPSSILGLHWESKTIQLLLSPYFEKETVAGRLTVLQYGVISGFLLEALLIVGRRLNIIENKPKLDILLFEEQNRNKKVKKYKTWREEQIAKLEDDLDWHAKSFALRLMYDNASEDEDKREQSRSILNGFLIHDKKFVKFVEDTMHTSIIFR